MRRLIRSPALPIALLLLLAPACAGQAKPDTPGVVGPPAAGKLDAPPIAVKIVEAGADVDESAVTNALADAVTHASGVGTVDEFVVKAALEGGCPEPPCQTEETAAYANAEVLVTASVMRAGDTWLANGRALRGARVLGRATASGNDAQAAVQRVGWKLGAELHEELRGVTRPPADADVDAEPGVDK